MNEIDIKLLQEENKALTKRINDLKFAINTYRDILKIDKYKQALQEIKEIAETYLTDCQGFKCEAMEEIIQKLTKAEV